ncbi:MAG: hemolysin family protein, partial [Chloroflexota bacterium]
MSFPLGEILFLVFLTFLEGFFVAAEIALVSVRRSRIDQLVEEGNPGARRVRRLIDDPGRFLAVSQLGLTLIGFFASAFAAVSLVANLSTLLESFGVDAATAESVGLVIVTIILALFTIVFAELIPKAIALGAPERFALVLSRPIDVLARVLGPIVSVLNGITRWVARSMGVDMNQEAQISADELRLIVERGGEQGVLEAEEEQMINAVIELGERRVHEVMIPRVAIAGLGADASLEEAIDLVVDVGHSRIPVYRESIDD